MTDAIRFPLVLGLISLSSAAGLAVSYRVTYDRIRFQEELTKARGLSSVLGIEIDERPGAAPPWREAHYDGLDGQPPEAFVVYEAADPTTGQRLYAAEGKGQGYSSKLQVVVAVDPGAERGPGQATVKAIRIVGQHETPGLGSRCTDEPDFQRQFERLPEAMLDLVTGTPYRDPAAPGSDQQPVAAITGATLTSNAALTAVRRALDRIRHHLQHRTASQ
jgi:RnfABCDGE-type electron transport complex G subunit